MPAHEPRVGEQTKAGLQFVGIFVFLVLVVIPLGDVMRGTSSPWVWRELSNHRHVTGPVDATLAILMYSAFYSLGFVLPYVLASVFSFARRLGSAQHEGVPDVRPDQRSARLYFSAATLVLYLLFLDSIVAFVRNLPTDVWNGWLLILGLALAGCLFYCALRSSKQ